MLVKKSSRINPGNKHLKAALLQSAWSATRTKDTFLNATYKNLVKRMGRKKALVAIGHKILVSAYYMLLHKAPYKELGAEFVLERKRDSRVQYFSWDEPLRDFAITTFFV